jgi:hypothetical protein
MKLFKLAAAVSRWSDRLSVLLLPVSNNSTPLVFCTRVDSWLCSMVLSLPLTFSK